MGVKDTARKISECYKIPENDGDMADTKEWAAARRAVDVAIFKAGIREVVEFVNDLIIGIEGCKFEERLDGDKGCIVLDMNENQWQAKLKNWGIREADKNKTHKC